MLGSCSNMGYLYATIPTTRLSIKSAPAFGDCTSLKTISLISFHTLLTSTAIDSDPFAPFQAIIARMSVTEVIVDGWEQVMHRFREAEVLMAREDWRAAVVHLAKVLGWKWPIAGCSDELHMKLQENLVRCLYKTGDYAKMEDVTSPSLSYSSYSLAFPYSGCRGISPFGKHRTNLL